MFGFFNKEDRANDTMQTINVVAATLATIRMVQDPSTVWRFGFDLAVHGITFIALRYQGNLLPNLAGAGLNCARLGAIYADATSLGEFGGPELADVLLHSANVAMNMWNSTP